jgi:hypothetical protein
MKIVLIVPGGVTVNSECCKELSERLWNDTRRKRPEKWKYGIVLLRGSTQYDTSVVIRQSLGDKENYRLSSSTTHARLGILRFLPVPRNWSDKERKSFEIIPKIQTGTEDFLMVVMNEISKYNLGCLHPVACVRSGDEMQTPKIKFANVILYVSILLHCIVQ